MIRLPPPAAMSGSRKGERRGDRRTRHRERRARRRRAVEATGRRTSCSRSCAASARCTGAGGSSEYPDGGRLLVGDDRRRRPRGQPRLGDLLLGTRRRHGVRRDLPARALRGRCSSAWTRPSTTASRRCSSAASRRSGSPTTRTTIRAIVRDVLDRLDGPRDAATWSADVAQPVVSRVIGSFMGTASRGRRDLGAAS